MKLSAYFRRATLVLLCLALLCAAAPAHAQGNSPDDILAKVGFDQRLDAQVPLDLVFRDERGEPARLGSYFGAKPVALLLAYYQCPNLCTLALTQLVETMRGLEFSAGDQFEVVTVSIDPRETPALAAAKKATYLARYGRPGAAEGWHFLTGAQAAIQPLAQSIGFRYAYDASLDQYAHPTGVVILTPQGRVSRYFYGISYTARDLRFGLEEASSNRIGSPIDQVLLRCYHYDPVSGKYNLVVMDVARMGGLSAALILGAFVAAMLIRERRRQPRARIEDRK